MKKNIERKLICNIHSKDILLLSFICCCLKLHLWCTLCQNNGRKLLAFKFSWDRWMDKDMHLIHPAVCEELGDTTADFSEIVSYF